LLLSLLVLLLVSPIRLGFIVYHATSRCTQIAGEAVSWRGPVPADSLLGLGAVGEQIQQSGLFEGGPDHRCVLPAAAALGIPQQFFQLRDRLTPADLPQRRGDVLPHI